MGTEPRQLSLDFRDRLQQQTQLADGTRIALTFHSACLRGLFQRQVQFVLELGQQSGSFTTHLLNAGVELIETRQACLQQVKAHVDFLKASHLPDEPFDGSVQTIEANQAFLRVFQANFQRFNAATLANDQMFLVFQPLLKFDQQHFIFAMLVVQPLQQLTDLAEVELLRVEWRAHGCSA